MQKSFLKIFSISFLLLSAYLSKGQEVQCNVIVTAQAINGVDQKIFKALQQTMIDFVNQRTWTTDEFAPQEKVIINFNLNITRKDKDIPDVYEGKLSIQSTRPVHGTDYTTPLLNYVDDEVRFKYTQFAPIDFNENRISGNDPMASNLSAILGYYVYLSLGLDYESFKFKGGQDFFNKATNIVTNAPEGNGIAGWNAQNQKQKNRYWLINNILNPRFLKFREESLYNYHRQGLDVFAESPEKALTAIKASIESLNQINTDNPSSAIIFLYCSAKNTELLNFLKKMNKADREKYGFMLSQIDIPNSQNYLSAKQ
jgi:Domain of unknown function (DUF4835)